MEIQYSEKAKFFKPNIFNILNERKAKIAQKGVKVYDLFVGTPDFPPAEHVMKVVQEAALNPENYKLKTGMTVVMTSLLMMMRLCQ